MAEQKGTRIRVILRWVQILDKLEPAYKEKGEFVFRARVSTKNFGGKTQETRMPETGYYSISDHPRFNRLNHMDKILFEGEVSDHLLIEMEGEELDQFSANDMLERYGREYNGPVAGFLGWHQPDAEHPEGDPENLSNWRLGYEIERID